MITMNVVISQRQRHKQMYSQRHCNSTKRWYSHYYTEAAAQANSIYSKLKITDCQALHCSKAFSPIKIIRLTNRDRSNFKIAALCAARAQRTILCACVGFFPFPFFAYTLCRMTPMGKSQGKSSASCANQIHSTKQLVLYSYVSCFPLGLVCISASRWKE